MIRISLAGAAAAIACLAAGPAAAVVVDLSTLVQWKVSEGGNGHYYALTNARSTWTDSYAAATAAGGDLASIASAAENSFIGAAFGFDRTLDTVYWLGLRRTAAGGPFSWTDGSALTYTNFHPGEPNNANGIENYVATNWYAANSPNSAFGTWNDTPNTGVAFGVPTPQPYRGVVEFTFDPRAAVVPEPATWALMIAGFGMAGGLLRRRAGAAFA
ncbi:MAG: PEPxxWA-CTERM sorting domain-containing protein [Pseudomonadota bacterium]